MKIYIEIIFLQGEAASETITLLEKRGEKAALKYLKQFEQEDAEISYDEIPNGSSDQIYCQGNYVLTYSTSLEYIGQNHQRRRIICIPSGK